MNQTPNIPVVMIPLEQFNGIIETFFKKFMEEITRIIESRSNADDKNSYITSEEFMAATKICRTRFDDLRKNNQIKSLKKSRKIYIPFSEINRYFNDPSIK